jgi:hypothetical protein
MQYQSAAKETGNFKTDPRTTDATDSRQRPLILRNQQKMKK